MMLFTPYRWKPVLGDEILGISIGRGSGVLKGLTLILLRARTILAWYCCRRFDKAANLDILI